MKCEYVDNFSFLESNERLDYCLQTKVIMKCEYVDKSMHISATQSLARTMPSNNV